MYGLPADFDLDVFIGYSLVWMTFSVGGVAFGFEPEPDGDAPGSIVVSDASHIAFRVSEDAEWEVIDDVPSVTGAPALLGRRVLSAAARNTGDIALTLDGDAELVIYEVDEPYEAYSLTIGERRIIV